MEETAKLKRELEKSVDEAREWALKAEMCRLNAEKEAQQQSHRLSEMQNKYEREVRDTMLEFPTSDACCRFSESKAGGL